MPPVLFATDDFSFVSVLSHLLTAIGGAAAGTLGTLIVNKAVQWRRRIRFRLDKWQFGYRGNQVVTKEGDVVHETPPIPTQAYGQVAIGVWNEKDVGTGLHDLKIEFRSGKKVRCSIRLHGQEDVSKVGRARLICRGEQVTQVNLPPREWQEVSGRFYIGNDDFQRMKDADSAWFVGLTPEERKYEHRVAEAPLATEPYP